MALILITTGNAMADAQSDMNRIEYWQKRFLELKPEDDPRVKKAHAIFERLLRVAGRWSDVHPKLHFIKTEPWNRPLPIALPEGWIVLSKKVLDICYQEPTKGDDRLAFILGHELAHQLLGDLWHLYYFQLTFDTLSQNLR